jgi:transposase
MSDASTSADPQRKDAEGAESSASKPAEGESRGPLMERLEQLLAERRDEPVKKLFAQVLARNGELERRLAKRRLGAANESEGITSAQLDMFLLALKDEANSALQEANEKLKQATKASEQPAAPSKPPRQPALRRPIPDHLRRVENIIPVPAEQRACPFCGKERKCIDHDVTLIIELLPPEVIVREDKREVLACVPACRDESELKRAPLGDKVVSGGIYGSALVGTMLVRKYDQGMPLHRIREELLRYGLDMPSASASDQIQWATDLMRPLWHQAQDDVLRANFVQLDPTNIPVRDKEHGFGIQLGSLCAYVGDAELVAYLYASSGKKNGQRIGELGPEDFLKQRIGLTMADASNAFDKTFCRPGMLECGCSAHARRGFVKALDSGDTRAAMALAAFKRLYDVEEEAASLDVAERRALRQAKSRPIYEELLAWCKVYRPLEPPSTPLAKACGYVINHYVALTRFLDHGGVPIDNMLVERLHRKPATGRAAFLFAGSHAGGERAAIAYSILGTCRLIGLNPVSYLIDVLPTLARGVELEQIPALMPKAWMLAHPDAAIRPLR